MQKLKQGVAVFMAIQAQSDTAMRNKKSSPIKQAINY